MKKLILGASAIILSAALLALLYSYGRYAENSENREVAKQPAPAEEEPGEIEGLRFEVVSTGAEPRKALRFRLPAGAQQMVRMQVRMDIAMSVNGNEIPEIESPPIVFPLRVHLLKVDEDGTATIVTRLEKPIVEKSETISPALALGLSEGLDALEGTGCRYRLDARGRLSKILCKTKDNAPDHLRRTVSQISEGLRTSYLAFPEEPVGVGASWKVYFDDVRIGGLRADLVLEYRLERVQESSVELALVSKATFDEQEANLLPGQLPPGFSAMLQEGASSGQGTIILDLNQLIPRSEIRTEAQQKMTVRNARHEESPTQNVATEVIAHLTIDKVS